jgi:hypothetical protein
MKPALFLAPALLTLGLSAASATTASTTALRPATAPSDTITVRLPNKAVMTLLVRDAAQLRQMKNYHLDSLTSRLGTYIAQAEAAAKTSKTERVTMEFYPDKDQPGENLPEQVRITTHKNAANHNRVDVLLNKKFGVNVVTNDDGHKSYDLNSGGSRSKHNADSTERKQREEHRNRSHFTDFRLDVGLNTLVNKKGPVANSLDLRPEGSRYLNIGWMYSQRLGGKRSPMFLSLGPEFSFNNYMLEGNNRWVNQNNITQVVADGQDRELQKSKLTTTTINVPLMLTMKLGGNSKGRSDFKLGVGGFAGYLLGQHTKIKYFEDGKSNKDKDRGSFNLNEFQYGVQGVIGVGDFTLFGKYNLNELFKDNRGPQVQALSFGLQFSGL